MSYKQSKDYEQAVDSCNVLSRFLTDEMKDLPYREVERLLKEKRDDQYLPHNMIEALEYSTYPPQYVIQKIKEMNNPRDPVFLKLVNELRKACFRTSWMWKESNMEIFDFLHRYKED